MRSAESILGLYRERKGKYSGLHQKMQQISNIYDGSAEVPLPELDKDEWSSVPNLLQSGIDQMAGRVASITPQVIFSSSDPGKRNSDRRARAASQAVTGWWQRDRLSMKMNVRARRLIAYAMAPVVMRWDFKKHQPTWEVRHPTETLPSLDLQPGQNTPLDCIFEYKRTIGYLVDQGYVTEMFALTGTAGGRPNDLITRDTEVTLVEYIDHDSTVLMACGWFDGPNYLPSGQGMKGVVLEAYQNMSESIPVVIPTRITLDRMTGQFDGMIGMYYNQAQLMALEMIAVRKGVFPDTYLVGRANEIPKIVDGPHDGMTGHINVVTGGDIKEIQTSPGYMTQQTIDRLERAQRITSGIPAEFGGESGTNIRTGRRGDAVLSAVIDFPVSEAQEAFAYALEEENRVGMEMAKRIDGTTPRKIFVGTGNTRRPVTYAASDVFEQMDHVVAYPVAGTDQNSLMIGLGQRLGLGYMSKRTAAELDPFVADAEAEHDAVIAEGLEQALVQSFQQQAATGAIPPAVVSKVMTYVARDQYEIGEAITKVLEEAAAAQQEQQQAPPGAPPTPDQMMAGGAQQGLAGGVSDPSASMPSMMNLGKLLGNLRKPVMAVQDRTGVPGSV